MTKKKRLAKIKKKKMKTQKIVKSIMNDMITQVEETVNPEEYFNIFYLTRDDINYILNINNNNVDMLNNLHVEKISNIGIYSRLFIRKTKTMDLEPWILVNHENKQFLVPKLIIKEINNNIDKQLSDIEIATLYIEKKSDLVETILFIINPELVNKKQKKLNKEQQKAKEIRDFLDEKNRIFNDRMKHSIKKNKTKLRS